MQILWWQLRVPLPFGIHHLTWFVSFLLLCLFPNNYFMPRKFAVIGLTSACRTSLAIHGSFSVETSEHVFTRERNATSKFFSRHIHMENREGLKFRKSILPNLINTQEQLFSRLNCPDGSDEAPDICGSIDAKTWTCGDKRTRIDRYLVCDGVPHCEDESDEKGCKWVGSTAKFIIILSHILYESFEG